MKCFTIFLAIAGLAIVDIRAQSATNIVNFTGARTKIAWFAATSSSQELKYFDTNEGQVRTLSAGFTPNSQTWNQGQIRISRSGKWITASDNTVTYIFDISGTSPNKRVFLDRNSCSYWCVKAFARDSVTGTEYAYAVDNFNYGMNSYSGTAIYRIPLKQDGSADISNAARITINSTARIDGSIAVSQDMKKIACLVPWATNPAILDVATGRLDRRLSGVAACHVNIAPDNSYRFFHLDDDHIGCFMFGANMSTQNQYVSFNFGAAQNWAPRWTNHPRVIASTKISGDIGETFMGSILLQKFAADYRSFESSLTVVSGFGGEAWIAGGYTGGGATYIIPSGLRLGNRSGLEIGHGGNSVTFNPDHRTASLVIQDSQGRTILRHSGAAPVSFDMKTFARGTYFVSAAGHGGVETRRLTLVR